MDKQVADGWMDRRTADR